MKASVRGSLKRSLVFWGLEYSVLRILGVLAVLGAGALSFFFGVGGGLKDCLCRSLSRVSSLGSRV